MPEPVIHEPFIKRFLPRDLLGRSLMIIVTPLVLLQVITGFIFYDSHWDKVSQRMARSVAGDVGAIVEMLRQYPEPESRNWVFNLAADRMEIVASLREGEILPNVPPDDNEEVDQTLAAELSILVAKPFQIEGLERTVVVNVQLNEGVLRLETTRKRLYSSTTYVFVLWMTGSSLILFAVALVFMRNQVKPVRRLAVAANAFGKGRDSPGFKPEGALEVRQAAAAFLAMRDRLQRQITQRTEMLAGVSHDLKTPLTRMKLQLALLGKVDGVQELKADVADMERMVGGYLAFARGEGAETPASANVSQILNEVVSQARRNGNGIDLHTEGELEMPLRKDAFRRCMTNLIDNALRYAEHVSVRAGKRQDAIEITVDDDGPGIPLESREEVFKPFYRIEGSRNPVTGGVGLGLTIARDVARSHGGDVELAESPIGGLRARVRLPL